MFASVVMQSRIAPYAFFPVSTGIGCEPLPRFRSSPSPCAALLTSFWSSRGGTEVSLLRLAGDLAQAEVVSWIWRTGSRASNCARNN